MKRVAILIACVVLLLLGCCKAPDSDYDVDFYSGIYPLKFWETEGLENSQFCAIPDMDAAIKIANVVFENTPKQKSEQAFKPQSVFYDEEDEVWVLLFRNPYPETGAVSTGPCYTIAIQKQDGKVLGINYE